MKNATKRLAAMLAALMLLSACGRDGEQTPEDAARLLSSLDRAQAGPTAPAQGLCLMEVFY